MGDIAWTLLLKGLAVSTLGFQGSLPSFLIATTYTMLPGSEVPLNCSGSMPLLLLFSQVLKTTSSSPATRPNPCKEDFPLANLHFNKATLSCNSKVPC